MEKAFKVIYVGGALVCCKIWTYIAGSPEGYPVIYGALGCNGLESICMPKNPVGHKTTIASACFSKSLFVYVRIFLQNYISELHEVAVIYGSILTPDVCKFVSSAICTSWVGPENKVSMIRPILHFMHEYRAIDSLGSSMDIENGRILCAFFISKWFDHPTCKCHAIIFKLYFFRFCYILTFKDRGVE